MLSIRADSTTIPVVKMGLCANVGRGSAFALTNEQEGMMNLSKPLGLVVIAGMLIPAPAALASQGNGKSGKPDTEKSEKADKDKKGKTGKESVPVHQVPEPATIALLGAAAGVAGARKLWQKRRRSSSV